MKGKETEKKGKGQKMNPDLESVKKLLKKKELQTNVLKKIIEQTKSSDTNPC
jgi:hypothetical protein